MWKKSDLSRKFYSKLHFIPVFLFLRHQWTSNGTREFKLYISLGLEEEDRNLCTFLCGVCVHELGPDWLCNPTDCSRQLPLFTGFPRQQYWSGFPSPANLPDQDWTWVSCTGKWVRLSRQGSPTIHEQLWYVPDSSNLQPLRAVCLVHMLLSPLVETSTSLDLMTRF